MTASAEPTQRPPLPPSEDELAQAEARPPWRKVAFLAAFMAILLAIGYLSPLREHLGKVRELSESIRGLGWLGPLVITSSVAVLVAVGFPRLAFCVLAGMAFGF